ncbi:DUF192 domain-containing protein [Sphingosinicella sp. BN140058]|uniref:DUF192 domain-containing protein n=1 Tax=Sphingosinicella sp. BN140058 TaxID=1892855 RepID=UPI001010AFF4|nr:DUF192 domain-containing protein [Sphingosinicella sp. BN140058]QAY78301.1 DUF192 domain-containing protein [Sphingosinicella sp. BN140058]
MRRAIGLAASLAALPLAACQKQPEQKLAAFNDTAAPGESEATHPVSGLPVVRLGIVAGGRTHHFTVEVAPSADEQAYGLMNRQQIAPTEGMLFPFARAQPAQFWMKNTLIPLDMIFIRGDGSIARIASAAPLSLEPVGVSEPVLAVLEIAGGRAAELGITADARISWPGGPQS